MGHEESSVILKDLGPHFPVDVKFIKFPNLGNTCYANALVQAMLNSSHICSYLDEFFTATHSLTLSPTLSKSPLMQFLHIYRQHRSSAHREAVIQPGTFLSAITSAAPSFVMGRQHDSHELYLFLMQSFDETIASINTTFQLNLRPFTTLVSSHSTTHCECLMCAHHSKLEEDFINFYLSIEKRQSLVSRLRDSQMPEYLYGVNKRFCKSCKIPQEMKIHCEYVELPKVAVFQLQRFVLDPVTKNTKKLHDCIPFPSMLTINQTRYELRSVVVHIGAVLTVGHFVAILRISEKWILASDLKLNVLDNNQVEEFFAVGEGANVCSTTAYVLFYEMFGS
jgi:ubiquitin carboxyl-terminal hydrolase 12/46